MCAVVLGGGGLRFLLGEAPFGADLGAEGVRFGSFFEAGGAVADHVGFKFGILEDAVLFFDLFLDLILHYLQAELVFLALLRFEPTLDLTLFVSEL